jgi:hypothetical protein
MTDHPFFALFENPDAWQVFASGQAEGRLSRTTDTSGKSGLRLDYDFHGGGGFVVLRQVLRFQLPETFEIAFRLRGEGPPNHFEFKVADPGGANVWRHLRADFVLPEAWTDCRIRERDLRFAWGPAGGGGPAEVEAVEFVIAAGPGGKGTLELLAPTLADQTLRKPHAVHASSQQPGFPPDAVLKPDAPLGWRAATDDPRPTWAVDFGHPARFGGLVIEWPEPLPPRCFQVESSADGETWTVIHRATAALGTRSHIPTPGAEARHLRLTFGNPQCAALRAITLRPDAFSSTPNEFIHAVAKDFPRGWFPRYWHREQSYWTPVGSPEGRRRALINEEGMVEVDEAGFSLEPFLLTDDGLVTWADAETSLALPVGGVPLPSVTWKSNGLRLRHPDPSREDEVHSCSSGKSSEPIWSRAECPDHRWRGHSARRLSSAGLSGFPPGSGCLRLEILPWVDGRGEDLTLRVTYRLKCSHPAPNTRLIVAVRPFQVNPPWQAFRNLGGRSPIHRITCAASGMAVGERPLTATPSPQGLGAGTFEEGGVLAFLATGTIPPQHQVEDESGLASAAMVWDLPAGQSALEVTVSVPYFGKLKMPAKSGRTAVHARWRKTLDRVQWEVPSCATPAFDCFRTAAGHILINRDGPAIQPGPRRYTRSWVRDCVIMGAALAKAGLPTALHEFLTWYAQFQRADGFIPCVVDRDGVDWLVEHDSHGQFIWGVREVIRHGGDRQFLAKMLPHVRLAADYLIALRAERLTVEYQTGEHAACFGLLPESASHEGYLAHPVHSYWDDFWGVRGLEAAVDLAAALGLTSDAERWQTEAKRFQHDLLRSIDHVIAGKNLAYIPGSVEWADFDPTATSNAIAQLDFADVLPAVPLHAMLATYLDGFRRKHRGEMPWNNYTAYEIRIIGAFVRLGNRAEANALLEFFLSDRRPLEWNQWPEITWRDPRSPGHLGDVPHTWIAAEYLLAVASMVASERETTGSLVLASGMPWAWISGEVAFSVKSLPTRFGTLDFSIHAVGVDSIHVTVGGTLTLPPDGLSITPPLPAGMRIVAGVDTNGNDLAVATAGDLIEVPALPFRAVLELGPAQPAS